MTSSWAKRMAKPAILCDVQCTAVSSADTRHSTSDLAAAMRSRVGSNTAGGECKAVFTSGMEQGASPAPARQY